MERSPNKGYYHRRIIRPKKWKEIQAAVKDKLHKYTIVLFLQWFYDFLITFTEEPKHHLPGNRLGI
jgi:hypothetical protein